MWPTIVPILLILALVQLILVLLPNLWREVRSHGLRWHHYYTFIGMPAFITLFLASNLAEHHTTWSGALIGTAAAAIAFYLAGILRCAIGFYRARRGGSSGPASS